MTRWSTLRLGMGAGLALFALWHGRLVGAIALGLGVAVTVYLAQINRLYISWLAHRPWPDWRRLWYPANRPLTIACLSGGLVATGVYLATGFWSWLSFSWLALGLVLQGVGAMATLGLAGLLFWRWQRDGNWPPSAGQPAPAANPLTNLAAPDPMTRLLAIHQVLDWVQSPAEQRPAEKAAPALGSLSQGRLRDYFRLMLAHETEPIIQQALHSALEQLAAPHERFQHHLQPTPRQPLQMSSLGRERGTPIATDARQMAPTLAPELQNADFT
ncbi:MAG: hypothetical protein VKK04_08870 [Synechococcales bacterium]|nr:hypothetical protein [Synechococcales bacterium]